MPTMMVEETTTLMTVPEVITYITLVITVSYYFRLWFRTHCDDDSKGDHDPYGSKGRYYGLLLSALLITGCVVAL